MTRKALSIIIGAALALAFVIIAPAVRADDLDQSTQVTFNQPVQLPGNVVLPAGTYWLTLPENALTNPNLVRIFNVDRTRLEASFLTIPTTRTEATSRIEVKFAEQSSGEPIALMSWFYPGRLTGHEFVYSPVEEARLSEGEHITVMAQPAPLVQAG